MCEPKCSFPFTMQGSLSSARRGKRKKKKKSTYLVDRISFVMVAASSKFASREKRDKMPQQRSRA